MEKKVKCMNPNCRGKITLTLDKDDDFCGIECKHCKSMLFYSFIQKLSSSFMTLERKKISLVRLEKYIRENPDILKYKYFCIFFSFCYVGFRKILKIILPNKFTNYVRNMRDTKK